MILKAVHHLRFIFLRIIYWLWIMVVDYLQDEEQNMESDPQTFLAFNVGKVSLEKPNSLF